MLEQPFHTEPVLADACRFIPGLFRRTRLALLSSAWLWLQRNLFKAIPVAFFISRFVAITVHLEERLMHHQRPSIDTFTVALRQTRTKKRLIMWERLRCDVVRPLIGYYLAAASTKIMMYSFVGFRVVAIPRKNGNDWNNWLVPIV